MDRRRFVKLAIGAGTLVAISSAGIAELLDRFTREAQAKSAIETKKRSYGFLIDINRCDGCKLCTAACREAHYVTEKQEWIKVYTLQDNDFSEPYFFPRPCMNCQEAPCVRVCPVGATYYNDESIVVIDNRRCIGCRFCMAACPYQVRHFNWDEPEPTPPEAVAMDSPDFRTVHIKGTVEKCMFCAGRIKEGKLPVCVEKCPMRALFFGDFTEDAVSNPDETWKLSEVLRARHAYRYKEELGTEPQVFYVS